VEQRVKRRGHRVLHAAGRESLTWVLLDLGDIVVHAFLPATREYYDLEMRWADADKVPRESLPEVPPLPEPPAPPSE
jgi:ribosome-associated protein